MNDEVRAREILYEVGAPEDEGNINVVLAAFAAIREECAKVAENGLIKIHAEDEVVQAVNAEIKAIAAAIRKEA